MSIGKLVRIDTVSFKPINPRNAIQEAVFLVHLIRPLFEHEAAAIKKLHEELKEELPKLTQQPAIQIMAASQVPQALPFEMTLFGPDGGVARRVAIGGAGIAVNELLYTRWADVSKRAIGYIQRVLEAIVSATASNATMPIAVRAVALQVIDRFVWTGAAADFAIEKALVRPFDRLPSAIWQAKNPWIAAHSKFDLTSTGNVVDRLEVTTGMLPPDSRMVQIDNIIENQFSKPLEPPKLITSNSAELYNIYSSLHDRNKAMLRELIVEFLRKQIGIDNA